MGSKGDCSEVELRPRGLPPCTIWRLSASLARPTGLVKVIRVIRFGIDVQCSKRLTGCQAAHKNGFRKISPKFEPIEPPAGKYYG